MNPENIQVVLVGTTHPGNVGASARALKTMGLTRLVLVAPVCDVEDARARANATHAADIVTDARLEQSLDAAVADCGLVVGLTARRRRLAPPTLDCRRAAARIVGESDYHKVGVVFGREHSGLTNAELDRCHLTVEIPANPEYPVLNLAAAVQVMCYEIRMVSPDHPRQAERADTPVSSAAELERFYAHLEMVVTRLGMFDPGKPSQLMRLMRALFARGRPDRKEIAALRGILSRMERRLDG